MISDSLKNEILDGFDFYKNRYAENTKYSSGDKITHDKLSNFRKNLITFSDDIFSGFEIIDHGKWQNSGNISKYIWNRYKPRGIENKTNLIICFAVLAEPASFYISIDLIKDNINNEEKRQKDKIYEFLETECKKIHVEGFKLGKFSWERNIFFAIENIDNFTSLDYASLLNALTNVYRLAYDKFYKNIEHNGQNNSDSKGYEMTNDDKKLTYPLNQILYGPPGTGKTYNTIAKAIEIIETRKVGKEEINGKKEREILKKEFDEYMQSGQIKFVTFHQSYGYEEFVEGIKAKNDTNGNLKYEVEDGVFKALCQVAKKKNEIIVKTKDDNKIINEENFKELYDSYVLTLPEYSTSPSSKVLTTQTGYEFYLYKNTTPSIVVRAKNGSSPMSVAYSKLKRVLFDGEEYTYSSYEPKIIDDMRLDIQKYIVDNSSKNYVLIIDEINRGNISKIFGELITLIEPSKRLGADDEIMVELLYSKEKFGVPSNLSIIGTMNTADRSIALMDTALRRRFEFVEMMPEYNNLKEVAGIDIGQMLKTINERIEYLYDRDHTIGHAYFIDVAGMEALANAFKNKILPLLQEYFYDDWEKIRLVLGDSQFIKEKKPANALFKSGTDYINDKILYEIDKEAFYDEQNYLKIYNLTSRQADEAKPANDY
ncbi:McrB family protein [Campylobacter concisus]